MNREELKNIFGEEELKDIVINWYVNDKKSTHDITHEFKRVYDIETTANVTYQLLKEFNVSMRDMSESVSLATRTLDYDISILDKNSETLEALEGLIISDGMISIDKKQKYHRFSISSCQKEFIEYCRTFFKEFNASEINARGALGNSRNKGYEKSSYSFYTSFHPDFTKQRIRWYREGTKIIPKDVKITPLMLKLWYYGDGSIVTNRNSNTCVVRLSTDGFLNEDIDFLVKQLEIQVGILSKNSDKRIKLKTSSIPDFFNFIGRASDIDCYAYKFDVDEWRFWKGMKQVAKEVGIPYNRLNHLVGTNSIEFNRSPGGKKVCFTGSQVEKLKSLHRSGLLSADARVNSSALTKHSFKREPNLESNYINVKQKGFPYVSLTEAEKIIIFNRLNNIPVLPIDNKDINASYKDNNLTINYHPHLFKTESDGFRSPYGAFNEKKTLMDTVEKLMKKNALSDDNLRYNICRASKTKRISVFPVRVAKTLYTVYGKDNMNILDPCAGYSSRLIGFYTCARGGSYTGIEPCVETYDGLINTQKDLEKMASSHTAQFYNDRAEVVMKKLDKEYDVIFTSPPYFDLEKYSEESSQSYKMYPKYQDWLDGFLFEIIKESHRLLKDDGIFMLNIANSRSQKIIEHVDMFVKKMFRIENVLLMHSPSVWNDAITEPIFCLKKI